MCWTGWPPAAEAPVGLLRRAGLPAVARGLQGTLEAPPDQRGGLYETALTALGCLESEAVLRYVTPPHTWLTPPRATSIEPIAEFDPWRFLVGYHTLDGVPQPYDTLYLLTREGAGTGAPVVAALVDHLLRTAAAGGHRPRRPGRPAGPGRAGRGRIHLFTPGACDRNVPWSYTPLSPPYSGSAAGS